MANRDYDKDIYMTVNEAADRLGVVPLTVKRYVYRGRLSRLTLGNGYNYVVLRSEIEDLRPIILNMLQAKKSLRWGEK